MELRIERQQAPVADEVSAILAIVRPILRGVLYGLKQEVVEDVGGYDHVKLLMLARLYRAGDGDCGICFEYAVHDAIQSGHGSITERVHHSLTNLCNVSGNAPASILFGAEKTGSQQLIEWNRGSPDCI